MKKKIQTLLNSFAHLAVKYLNLGFQNWNLKKLSQSSQSVFFIGVYAVYLSSRGFMNKNLRTLRKTFAHLAVKPLNLGIYFFDLSKKSMTFKSCFILVIIVWFINYLISAKVSPWLMSPVLKPFLNQYILCSDDPCVNESGTTCPLILL
ncbi:hypothetical protein SAMN05444397_102220 [Flavobacterium aquidurense]|nr:hypothetical protein SAMN05444397_102220 [Flavobacterium aquidurense]